jgi:diguanylate cyclase (GGDEF)-like protein
MSSDRNQHGMGRRVIFEESNKPSKRTFLRDDQRDDPPRQPRIVESIVTRLQKSQSQNFNSKFLRAVCSHAKDDAVQGELLNMAFRDDLTGLYSRRGFLMLAEQQLRLARRSGHGAFLFFLDLDGLKRINDTLGHQTGDFALMEAADLLRVTFRDSDILARFGGDEFAVLVIEAGDRSEEIIMRRLEENQSAKCGKHRGYPLLLSVGCARFDPRHPCSIGLLMVRADEAMYDQKRKHGISDYAMTGDKRA